MRSSLQKNGYETNKQAVKHTCECVRSSSGQYLLQWLILSSVRCRDDRAAHRAWFGFWIFRAKLCKRVRLSKVSTRPKDVVCGSPANVCMCVYTCVHMCICVLCECMRVSMSTLAACVCKRTCIYVPLCCIGMCVYACVNLCALVLHRHMCVCNKYTCIYMPLCCIGICVCTRTCVRVFMCRCVASAYVRMQYVYVYLYALVLHWHMCVRVRAYVYLCALVLYWQMCICVNKQRSIIVRTLTIVQNC